MILCGCVGYDYCTITEPGRFLFAAKRGKFFTQLQYLCVYRNGWPERPIHIDEAIFHQDELKNRLICTLFFKLSLCPSANSSNRPGANLL